MTSSSDALKRLRTDAVHFGRQVEKYTWDVIGSQPTRGDQKRPIAIAMVVRMCRTHEAICNLVASELNDGAAALLRCMLEQFFLFEGVRQDPKNLDLAIEEMEKQRRIALEGLLNLTDEERGEGVTVEAITAALVGNDAKRSFKASRWAEVTGYAGQFNTLWRSLSDYAHGSLVAVERYLEASSDGLTWDIKSKVELVTSCEYPITSGSMLLEAARSMNQAPMTETLRHRYAILLGNLTTIQESYWRVHEEDLKG